MPGRGVSRGLFSPNAKASLSTPLAVGVSPVRLRHRLLPQPDGFEGHRHWSALALDEGSSVRQKIPIAPVVSSFAASGNALTSMWCTSPSALRM